ncbi:hypothetical protein J2Y69_003581 [Microbacterium resistens]|uniref:Uncharacterized protein n=1 Tax=Microbacterium resistens TaxID=156977 RepID=A0ABU1SH90_9MICO|nr:hypothetical protein [Microbacterium resistens]
MSVPDYNRACEACSSGGTCSQPYEALGGTTYWCKLIFPATPGENREEWGR